MRERKTFPQRHPPLPRPPWHQPGEAAAPKEPGRFDAHPFGFVHADLKHLPSLGGKKAYIFVAIERATRFVHVEVAARRDAITIAGCFERFLKAFGQPVHTVLTDNGSEFTDRFGGAYWRKTSGPQAITPSTGCALKTALSIA